MQNRVFHYEPIWHWKDLPAQHNSIVNLTRGLSTFASEYLGTLDLFEKIYLNGRSHTESKLEQFLLRANCLTEDVDQFI